MLVTADPSGNMNSIVQILRYSTAAINIPEVVISFAELKNPGDFLLPFDASINNDSLILKSRMSSRSSTATLLSIGDTAGRRRVS